ncbi:putative toxin-antitoxin system toxin component, PIN family [Lewinellaceae bacterium SD302]|nr:putative toxin-antitoxin system toxin component, PIN family [Lewinellaceae bacterium SD302]
MKVIIDTNILLVSLKRSGVFRPIFDHLIRGSYHLIITNEILSEYMEIIGQRTKPEIANNLGDLLTRLKNVDPIETYFNWMLITVDQDDNKFVDAAVAGNVDYLVTKDGHFKVLQSIEFPQVNVITPEDFIEVLKEL